MIHFDILTCGMDDFCHNALNLIPLWSFLPSFVVTFQSYVILTAKKLKLYSN